MEKELLKKQLLYRSIHRGCKETDFLIGEFAKEKIKEMPDEQLNLFNDFLQEDDLEMYDWVLGKTEGKKKYSELLEEIRKFHKL